MSAGEVAQRGRKWWKCVAILPFYEDKGNGFRASGKDAPLLSLQRRERRVKVRGDREKTAAYFGLHGLFFTVQWAFASAQLSLLLMHNGRSLLQDSDLYNI